MIKVLAIRGRRNYDNPHTTPDGHWVELSFENDHGVHTVELNGERPLPEDVELRREVEWLLWDYGLLCQQDSKNKQQRVRIAQEKFDGDRLNYLAAKTFLAALGGST